MKKTNAMRYLDQLNISYEIFKYNVKDGLIDGIHVAQKIKQPMDIVYKTLLLQGEDYFVCMLPVHHEIQLKKMAKAIHEKKIQMVPVKEIRSLTGYIRGGCSPFAMTKEYPKYIQEDVILQDSIVISAGKIGLQMKMKVEDFLRASKALLVNVSRSIDKK